MTKSELEEIRNIHKEIRMWEQELSERRSRSPVSSPSAGTFFGGERSDKVGSAAAANVDLERRIEAHKQRLQELRDRAIAYILRIPDSLTRTVIYYRCVSVMSWARVAYEVGGNNTEESVKKMYQRHFLREEKSCPECPE